MLYKKNIILEKRLIVYFKVGIRYTYINIINLNVFIKPDTYFVYSNYQQIFSSSVHAFNHDIYNYIYNILRIL
jgi:hypothetical protein